MHKISFFALILFSACLQASAITLTNEKEIHRAKIFMAADQNISEKVMTCVQAPGGSIASCGCPDIDSCKFKPEFEKSAALYCKIKDDFPEWSGRLILYYEKNGKDFTSFSMSAYESQLGKHCE